MNIGIDNKQSEAVAKMLNQYLADLQVLYTKVQNYHWNLEGMNFFALHGKFEELYDQINEEIDEVAERILTLGQRPLGTLKDFVATAKIEEAKNAPIDGKTAVQNVLADFEYVIRQLRDGVAVAEENNDAGTADMLTSSMAGYEKTCWMLRVSLK